MKVEPAFKIEVPIIQGVRNRARISKPEHIFFATEEEAVMFLELCKRADVWAICNSCGKPEAPFIKSVKNLVLTSASSHIPAGLPGLRGFFVEWAMSFPTGTMFVLPFNMEWLTLHEATKFFME